jgi:hypothetical protein
MSMSTTKNKLSGPFVLDGKHSQVHGRPTSFGRIKTAPTKGLYKALEISNEPIKSHRVAILANSPEQAVLLEVDRMLVVWSVSASFINALVLAPDRYCGLKSHAKFSAKPLIYAAVTAFDAELLQSMPAAQEVAAFYEALEKVRVHHGLVFAASVDLTPRDIQEVMDESKDINHMALRLVAALQQIDLTMDGATWSTEMAQVKELLLRITKGETPCNDGDKVVFPEWTRGRRSVRRWLGAEAKISLANTWHKVMVTDISEGGIGIQCDLEMAAGQIIEIEFDTGRMMTGEVARTAHPNKYGVKLQNRLRSCDPLLSS